MRIPLAMPTLAALLATNLAVMPPAPAMADSAGAGAAVFELKCAACHALGGNSINPLKTLKVTALEANGYASQDALVQLISNGKGQMPSYGPKAPSFARLTDEQIQSVAAFTLEQASAGWPGPP
jgi:cytochrome c6